MEKSAYLNAVAELVRRSDPQRSGLMAATLGNLILRNLPEHWNAHGYVALKFLLDDLRTQFGFEVGSGRHDMMTIWSDGRQTEQPVAATAKSDRSTEPHELKRLRKEIWDAFVTAPPRGRRFLERSKGAFVSTEAFFFPVVAGDWVEIPRIPEETQKSWVRAVLGDTLDNSLLHIVNEPGWYAQLASVLRSTRQDLLTKWNKARTENVTTIVDQWCANNGVSPSLVYLSARKPIAMSPPMPNKDVRAKLLSALARMTTEQLLEISIPAKYLLSDSNGK